MRLWLTILFIAIITILHAQGNTFDPNKHYHPDSLKNWTISIMDEISKKHPGFYRYTSKKEFDRLIDSTNQTITTPLTELGYYRKLKPLFAQIGCLHTDLSLSVEYRDYLNKTSTFIPLEIFIDTGKKVFISQSHDLNQEIPVGGEIVSINGESITSILKRLYKAIPSDGYNETEKTLLLNHRFASWYQTIIDTGENFTVEVSIENKIQVFTVKGVSIDKVTMHELSASTAKKQLKFETIDSIGVLTAHSFSKSEIKENGQHFKKFIQETFEQIDKENIKDLIIDLRYNTGGTDGNAAFLAAYFFDKPFRYWDKIEVTEAIAKEIKGFNRLFYKRPQKVDTAYQWEKTWITKEFDYYEIQHPAAKNFKGQAYIITNGLCLSSCSDFVAVLSHNNKAIIVGQETGGGFQGNTSGMMPVTKIQAGLQVTVPLQKYTNAVDLTQNFGYGTKPDHEVIPAFEDWINKKDIEMEFILILIKKQREQ